MVECERNIQVKRIVINTMNLAAVFFLLISVPAHAQVDTLPSWKESLPFLIT